MTSTGRMLFRPAAAAAVLLAGLLAGAFPDFPVTRHLFWSAGLYLLGIPLLFRTVRGVLRARFNPTPSDGRRRR
jgi:hypothetical protein